MKNPSELPSLASILLAIDSVDRLYVANEPIGSGQSRFFKEQTKLRLMLAGLFMYADFAEMPDQLRDVVCLALQLGDGVAQMVSLDSAFNCSSYSNAELHSCFEMIESRLDAKLFVPFHAAFDSVVGGFPKNDLIGHINARGTFEYPPPFPNSASFSTAFEAFCRDTAPAVVQAVNSSYSKKYAAVVIQMIDVLLGESMLFLPFKLMQKYQAKLIKARAIVSSWEGMHEDGDVYYTDSLLKKLSPYMDDVA